MPVGWIPKEYMAVRGTASAPTSQQPSRSDSVFVGSSPFASAPLGQPVASVGSYHGATYSSNYNPVDAHYVTQHQPNSTNDSSTQKSGQPSSQQTNYQQPIVPRGTNDSQYEQLDPSKLFPSHFDLFWLTRGAAFFVRDKGFFSEGRVGILHLTSVQPDLLSCLKVFSVMYSETAGDSSRNTTTFKTSVSQVRFAGHFVHTQIRRFVVVRQKREFCYAWWVLLTMHKKTQLIIPAPLLHIAVRGRQKLAFGLKSMALHIVLATRQR